jgi:replicative DNA helicase
MKPMENKSKTLPKYTVMPQMFEHGKIPPQAIDLEEVVLGAMMLENRKLEEVISILKPEIFYKEEHQRIYNSIHKLYGKHKNIDILTVTEHLRSSGELDLVGGAYYIAMLTNRVVSSYNIESHARILIQKFIQRELIRIGSETIQASYEDTTDVFDLLDTTEKQFIEIREFSLSGGGMKHISEIGVRAREDLLRREQMAKDGKCSGIKTPLKDLTKLTKGWQPAELIVLAGRPGQGKTSLLISFAKEAAHDNVPVCLYELEMSDISLHKKLILSECDIDLNNFMSGYMSSEDWTQYELAEEILNGLPIYVDDNARVSMNYVRNHAKLMKKKGLCGLIGIDYLGLMDMKLEEKGRNREQEVAQASRMAKLIAKELNVPVILLAQLNRENEKGGDPKPKLSNLRESGAIEQDADIVLFTYRPSFYNIMEDSAGNSTENTGIISIGKNRNGACKEIPYKHNESMTKIFDYGYDDTYGDSGQPFSIPKQKKRSKKVIQKQIFEPERDNDSF